MIQPNYSTYLLLRESLVLFCDTNNLSFRIVNDNIVISNIYSVNLFANFKNIVKDLNDINCDYVDLLKLGNFLFNNYCSNF